MPWPPIRRPGWAPTSRCSAAKAAPADPAAPAKPRPKRRAVRQITDGMPVRAAPP
ncbi:hypothetical protein LP419_07765 [Massilia sp. H-1]|nr:hypothetical protein LP419_07765 [Massilia sp. H-1]